MVDNNPRYHNHTVDSKVDLLEGDTWVVLFNLNLFSFVGFSLLLFECGTRNCISWVLVGFVVGLGLKLALLGYGVLCTGQNICTQIFCVVGMH